MHDWNVCSNAVHGFIICNHFKSHGLSNAVQFHHNSNCSGTCSEAQMLNLQKNFCQSWKYIFYKPVLTGKIQIYFYLEMWFATTG